MHTHTIQRRQVCVQPPTAAVNVTLPAFAAACCGVAAADCHLCNVMSMWGLR